jgi:hypothetical protein
MLLFRGSKVAKNIIKTPVAAQINSKASAKHSQFLAICMHRTAAALSNMPSLLFFRPISFSFSTHP